MFTEQGGTVTVMCVLHWRGIHGGNVCALNSTRDSDRVGPWTEGYLRTTTDGSGQVSNRAGGVAVLFAVC